MSSRSDLVVFALGALIVVAACRSRPRAALAAAAPPTNAYFIGPQPGPHRAFPRLVNPYADDVSVLPEGRHLFNRYNCSGCHGDHAGGGMEPSLRDSMWRYVWIRGRDLRIDHGRTVVRHARVGHEASRGPDLEGRLVYQVVTDAS
jgi:mono/diheme cytochrome c family protein